MPTPEPAPAAAAALASVIEVLRTEANAVTALADTAPAQAAAIADACGLIRRSCGDGASGRLVVTGVGKAGLIARKLSATFASTGTPSFFLHPAEARHGDLGMVQAQDVALALSNSGASEEVVALIPNFKRIGLPLIALVGATASPLARHADVVLSIGAVTEACPLGLAPSTSTTAMLALGDALALTVQRQRNFSPEQYARFHPGGALGRKLMTCAEAMRKGDRVAAVPADATVLDCLRATSRARAGSAVLVDGERKLLGIFTDGDLRRALSTAPDPRALLQGGVRAVATVPCRAIRGEELLQAALHLCAERKLNELPVTDDDGRLIGLLDIQDLVDRGFEV
jgi:arabinose-5-phosphate isomerase